VTLCNVVWKAPMHSLLRHLAVDTTNNSSRKTALAIMKQTRCAAWIVCGLALGFSGCFGPPNLPEELEVVMPNNVRRTVPAGTGPTIVENSTWSVFALPDADGATNDSTAAPLPGPYGGFLDGGLGELPPTDAPLYLIHFGEGGRILGVSENIISPEILGDEIIIDGAFHAQRLPGLSTAAVSFGVSEGDQIGAAFTLDVRFLGVPVGSGVIYAWGTKTETRIDGTLGRLLDLKPLPDLFFPSGGDQFPIFATP
jgi:hypothetical protein